MNFDAIYMRMVNSLLILCIEHMSIQMCLSIIARKYVSEDMLKIKTTCAIFAKHVILTIDNLANCNCYGSLKCAFIITTRQLNIYFCNASLTILYGQSSK
jgi:hypothetical protein